MMMMTNISKLKLMNSKQTGITRTVGLYRHINKFKGYQRTANLVEDEKGDLLAGTYLE